MSRIYFSAHYNSHEKSNHLLQYILEERRANVRRRSWFPSCHCSAVFTTTGNVEAPANVLTSSMDRGKRDCTDGMPIFAHSVWKLALLAKRRGSYGGNRRKDE